jgi:hypothetical protein
MIERSVLRDAYTRAGFKGSGNARRVAAEPKVVARLDYLLKRCDEINETAIAWRRASMRRWLEKRVLAAVTSRERF